MSDPMIIQGGMGVAISDWRLARAVAQVGHLGVVSGTGLDTVLARRLQRGDPGEHMRRALAHFPFPDVAARILAKYFIPDGTLTRGRFKAVPMHTLRPNQALQELVVAANFVEVFLAKEGHAGQVGLNLLEKVQLPTLPSLYGAMLAGVDYVLMGAGIPREIPGALDCLATHDMATLTVQVAEADKPFLLQFDPHALFGEVLPPLKRPRFLAIIASTTLATALLKRSTGRIDGFVIEGPTAGGHNAPPRGAVQYNERGEPLYGPRDEVDLTKIREMGVPFWLAGGCAEPEKLRAALAVGAAGIQVGTAFALCHESGLDEPLKQALLKQVLAGEAEVRTDPLASPTGFPFKLARVAGTLAEPERYAARPRNCDLGYLREPYQQADGKVGFRCPAEPVEAYVKKGGKLEDTEGRKCLCNGLVATAGFGQRQPSGYQELPIVTAGDDVIQVARFLPPGASSYSAADVIDYLTERRTS